MRLEIRRFRPEGTEFDFKFWLYLFMFHGMPDTGRSSRIPENPSRKLWMSNVTIKSRVTNNINQQTKSNLIFY